MFLLSTKEAGSKGGATIATMDTMTAGSSDHAITVLTVVLTMPSVPQQLGETAGPSRMGCP